MAYLVLLDIQISLDKEFKIGLKPIFGFSYIKLRHLNKFLGKYEKQIKFFLYLL